MNHKGKTLLFLATITTTTIHLINRFEYSRSTIKNLLSSTDNMYYEWRFGKIKYSKKGTGSPILCLHDLTIGSSSYEFYKICNELSKNHEVYCIDFLGYGLSDKPNITFTNYLYVQMITDFIKNIIGKRTNIIATGDAFPIAVMTCHNDSNLVRNLIGINPQSIFQSNQIPSKQTRILKLLLDTPILGTFIYNMHASKSEITRLFQTEYYYNPYNVEDRDICAYEEAAHLWDFHSKHAYASHLGRYTNTNIIHAIKEINNSIFILAGKHKEDINNIVDNYLYYNSAIEVSYIPKTKHLPHLEQPVEVLNCLSMYLNEA